MERFYTTNLSYLSSAGAAPNIGQCDNEVSPFYQVGLAAGTTARSFVLQAVPQGAQASKDTKCGTSTLNAQGVRGATGTASATPRDCWSLANGSETKEAAITGGFFRIWRPTLESEQSGQYQIGRNHV